MNITVWKEQKISYVNYQKYVRFKKYRIQILKNTVDELREMWYVKFEKDLFKVKIIRYIK